MTGLDLSFKQPNRPLWIQFSFIFNNIRACNRSNVLPRLSDYFHWKACLLDFTITRHTSTHNICMCFSIFILHLHPPSQLPWHYSLLLYYNPLHRCNQFQYQLLTFIYSLIIQDTVLRQKVPECIFYHFAIYGIKNLGDLLQAALWNFLRFIKSCSQTLCFYVRFTPPSGCITDHSTVANTPICIY